jgi:hypothetical protein
MLLMSFHHFMWIYIVCVLDSVKDATIWIIMHIAVYLCAMCSLFDSFILFLNHYLFEYDEIADLQTTVRLLIPACLLETSRLC